MLRDIVGHELIRPIIPRYSKIHFISVKPSIDLSQLYQLICGFIIYKFVKLSLFHPRIAKKGFSQVNRPLQRCFIWAPAPPLPPLPLIVNFDGQRLSPSLFLSPPISQLSRETHFFFRKLNSLRLRFQPAAAKPLKCSRIESSNLFVGKSHNLS